jgi:hypothetical protein
MLDRARKGIKPTAAEKERMSTLSAELAGRLEEAGLGSKAEKAEDLKDLLPLDFLLGILRNPMEDREMRIKVATLAAPYCHPRKGEAGTGKKDEQKEAAAKAGSGKYAPSKMPVRLVK